jgi:hypothetical protein
LIKTSNCEFGWALVESTSVITTTATTIVLALLATLLVVAITAKTRLLLIRPVTVSITILSILLIVAGWWSASFSTRVIVRVICICRLWVVI